MPRIKQKELIESADRGVRIRCRYCDIKDTCAVRPRKEAYENQGVMTRCALTPNRPGKKRKKK